jgi:hypothetical protein
MNESVRRQTTQETIDAYSVHLHPAYPSVFQMFLLRKRPLWP